MSSESAPRWLLAWGGAGAGMGTASLLVPLYAVELGGDALTLGMVAAAAAFSGAPGALVGGRLADRRPSWRPEILAASLAVVALALAALSMVAAVGPLLAATALLWFGFGVGGPVANLLVVEGVPEVRWKERIAELNTYQGWGWAGGLTLGLGWTAAAASRLGPAAAQRSLFALCAVIAWAAAAFCWRLILRSRGGGGVAGSGLWEKVLGNARRPNIRAATFPFAPARLYSVVRSIDPGDLGEWLRGPLGAYLGGAALFFVGFAAFFATAPLYLADQIGYGSNTIYALYLTASVAAAAAYAVAGRLASRYDLVLVQAAGLTLRGAALPAVAAAGAAVAALAYAGFLHLLLFAVIGISWAVIVVAAVSLVQQLVRDELRGQALGLYSTVASLGTGAGGLVGGWLAGFGFLPAYLAAAVLVFAGAGVVTGLRSAAAGA